MIMIAVITQEMVLHPTQKVMKEVTINAIGATTPIHLVRKAPCMCGAVRRKEAAAIGIIAKTNTLQEIRKIISFKRMTNFSDAEDVSYYENILLEKRQKLTEENILIAESIRLIEDNIQQIRRSHPTNKLDTKKESLYHLFLFLLSRLSNPPSFNRVICKRK